MSRPIWKNNKKLSNRNWIIVVPHPCVRKQPSFSCLPLTSSRINLQNPQFRKNFQYKPWRNLYPGRYVKYTERTFIKPSNSAHACGKKHTRVFLDCTTTECLNRKKKNHILIFGYCKMQASGKVYLENVCTLIHFFLRATKVSNK